MRNFKVSMIDDRHVFEGDRKANLLEEYQYNEILLYIKELTAILSTFDTDNIKNKLQMHLKATLGDLGVTFIQKFEKEAPSSKLGLLSGLKKQLVTNEHKIVWSQQASDDQPLLTVGFELANRKLRSICEDKSKFIDTLLEADV